MTNDDQAGDWGDGEMPVPRKDGQTMLDWIADVEVAQHQATAAVRAARSATDIDLPTLPGQDFPRVDRPEVVAAETHEQTVWNQWQNLNEQHYGWRMQRSDN